MVPTITSVRHEHKIQFWFSRGGGMLGGLQNIAIQIVHL